MFIARRAPLPSDVFRRYCHKAIKDKLRPPPPKGYGQPTPESHPQLLKDGEITPSISRSEYQGRREKLLNQVSAYVSERNPQVKNHLVVVPSSTKKYMSDKIPYFFRQNTDFLYLTGCQEPDSCLVLSTTDDQRCSTLFVKEKDDHAELWDGPSTGPHQALGFFGVDQSLPICELENYLQSHLKSSRPFTLWYDFMNPSHDAIHKTLCDYRNYIPSKMWESPKFFIHNQRLIKSPSEMALMQQSCDIASDAIIDTIKFSRPGMTEAQIFAKVDYECRMRGAEYLAYPPVVASGPRATIIHYINNNQIAQDGDMVLMDAGCEYHGYSSDITRTWPISGQFTPPQREVYEVVLETQKNLIELCHDFPTLDQLFDHMCGFLGRGLQQVGLIPKGVSGQQLVEAAYKFCPHHVSHYLGMDVHDTPLIRRNIKIRPGMVVTVEPGVYISPGMGVPKEFRGMGIRIEDDVLITEDGPVVLTKRCPKEIADIERLGCSE